MQAARERGARQQAESVTGVQLPQNRCPYCHTAVFIEHDDWVACRRCLARHHQDCRREAGACASCGDRGPALALREIAPVWRNPRPRPPRALPRARLILAAVGALVLGGFWLRWYVPVSRPRSATAQVVAPTPELGPVPDYLLGYLDFLESEGLYRTAIQKILSSEYRHDPILEARLDRYQAELRR